MRKPPPNFHRVTAFKLDMFLSRRANVGYFFSMIVPAKKKAAIGCSR